MTMTLQYNAVRKTPPPRRAVTIVETVISIVIVGTMLAAVMNTAGGAILGRQKTGDVQRGRLLAQDLMSEVLRQDYEDSDWGPGSFGLGFDEVGDGSRTLWDDVDDYDGWTATPPQYKNGVAIKGLAGWSRNVMVDRVMPTDVTSIAWNDTGIKHIIVTVSKGDAVVAELESLKSRGLPPPDATTLNILFVVKSPANLTTLEDARLTLMESWAFSVTTIAASAPQADFDSQVANHDAAYVPMEISDVELGTKLRDAAIGVLNEHEGLADDFGLSSSTRSASTDAILVDDNTHYITSLFPTGLLTIFSSTQPLYACDGSAPQNPQILAYTNTSGPNYYPSLVGLEAGETFYDGGVSTARRVQLPWGSAGFDFTALNADGQTIMRRAIEWVASQGTGGATCGDGTCDAGEDSCSCSIDCGVVAVSEVSGGTCTDGLDNDCDGLTDCSDADCSWDPACLLPAAVCGNSICESGEDCYTCSSDCASKLNGKASKRYCCGNGTLEAAEGDGTICDGNP